MLYIANISHLIFYNLMNEHDERTMSETAIAATPKRSIASGTMLVTRVHMLIKLRNLTQYERLK